MPEKRKAKTPVKKKKVSKDSQAAKRELERQIRQHIKEPQMLVFLIT